MAGKNKPVKKKVVRAKTKTKVKSVRARRPDTTKRVRRRTTRVHRRRRGIDARIRRAQRRNATMFKKLLFDPFGVVFPQGIAIALDPQSQPEAPAQPATNADYHNYIESMETAAGWRTQAQAQAKSQAYPPFTTSPTIPSALDLLLNAVGHIVGHVVSKRNLP